ncbi:MAG: hypothetical protein ACJ77Z_11080 [Thermoleophilaceae bacterium]
MVASVMAVFAVAPAAFGAVCADCEPDPGNGGNPGGGNTGGGNTGGGKTDIGAITTPASAGSAVVETVTPAAPEPQGVGSAKDTTAPVLVVPATLKAKKKAGKVAYTVTCSEACDVAAQLKGKAAAKARIRIAQAGSAKVVIKLSSRARKALRAPKRASSSRSSRPRRTRRATRRPGPRRSPSADPRGSAAAERVTDKRSAAIARMAARPP